MKRINEVKFIIGDSKIHGKGVIASELILNGELIGIAVREIENGPIVTKDLGIYVNHSYKANSRLVKNAGNYDLVAIKDISPGEEIVADYNFTPSYLEKPGVDFV